MQLSKLNFLWIISLLTVLIWSVVAPKDYFTWFLEVLPVFIGVAALGVTRKSFPLTSLVYFLILIHMIILMVGGHYTYAEVPLFDWIKDLTGGARNNYDKVGHFAQGFIPVMVAREIAIRKKVFNSKAWQNFFIVCFCLAFSAFYELIEWWVSVWTGEGAEAFLGTQGYAWDTQSDMFLALIGAASALVLLSRAHDRQLESAPNPLKSR